MTTKPLPEDIRLLPVAERVRLAEQIWASVAEDQEKFSLSSAQQAALRQRIAAHRSSPDAGKPWDEIKSDFMSD